MASKKELFLELASPNKNGESRWVSVDEFTGKYSRLIFGNGGDWCRGSSALAKEFKIETDKKITKGNSIDRIRTIGYQEQEQFNQTIRSDIKEFYKNKPCVMLGINGKSENTKIEIDHKDGKKNNKRVSNLATQTIDDFQPLSKAANDAKRQICKKCQTTDIRFDARIIAGYPEAYYKGGRELSIYGCEGCYQYDPVKYRKTIYSKKG